MSIFQTHYIELWHGDNPSDLWFGLGFRKQYVCDDVDYETAMFTVILFGKHYDLMFRLKTYSE